jgi:predicted oxidoreductase
VLQICFGGTRRRALALTSSQAFRELSVKEQTSGSTVATRRAFIKQTAAIGVAAAAAAALAEAGANTPAVPKNAMKNHKVPQTDLVVSRIAYGCDKLGWKPGPDAATYTSSLLRSFNEPLSADELTRAERAIRVAYENGVTFFDLADFYGGGKSEAAFGQVLERSPGLRDGIVIQTKCGNRLEQGFDLSHAHIVRAVAGSLQRLSTDHLDILLLHVPDALVEPEEVASAFEELQRSGKVRYFGLSNHTIGQIELLKKYVRQPLVTNQIQIGLANSGALAGFPFNDARYTGLPTIVDYCRLNEILVQAYAPLKGADDILSAPSLIDPPADAPTELKNAAQVLANMAKQKGTTPSALALAWLLHHPAGIVPITGATRPEHIIENCAADRIELNRQEWYTLFRAGAAIQRRKLA